MHHLLHSLCKLLNCQNRGEWDDFWRTEENLIRIFCCECYEFLKYFNIFIMCSDLPVFSECLKVRIFSQEGQRMKYYLDKESLILWYHSLSYIRKDSVLSPATNWEKNEFWVSSMPDTWEYNVICFTVLWRLWCISTLFLSSIYNNHMRLSTEFPLGYTMYYTSTPIKV